EAIVVEYEPRAAILDMEEALSAGEIIQHWKIRRGEATLAMGRGDVVVVEGTYHTPYQEHAYIEPNGMIALPDGLGGVTVHGSMQCSFSVQNTVDSAIVLNLNRLRVVHNDTAGS